MKMTELSTHGHRLTKWGLMNCYLVREQGPDGGAGSFTLIDTTVGGAASDILAAAKQLGAPIERLLLTHAHVDHVGSVDALAAALPGVSLAVSERSLPLLQRPPDKRLRDGEPVGKVRGGLPGIATRATHVVEDGELFGSLRCIATPGHIPGHFSFLDERDGTLYAGDALVGVRELAVSGWAPWYFAFPNLATWNKPTALESARKLLGYPVERVACGHGRVHGGGVEALRQAVESASHKG